MIRTDLLNQELTTDCVEVLQSYAVRESASRHVDSGEQTDWLERVDDVPGIDSSALSSVHGTLIAEGLLKFEVTGRCQGLQYQLTPLARDILANSDQLLESASAEEPEDSDDSADER